MKLVILIASVDDSIAAILFKRYFDIPYFLRVAKRSVRSKRRCCVSEDVLSNRVPGLTRVINMMVGLASLIRANVDASEGADDDESDDDEDDNEVVVELQHEEDRIGKIVFHKASIQRA